MRTQMTLPKEDFIQPVIAFKIKWDVTEVFCPQTWQMGCPKNGWTRIFGGGAPGDS